MVFSEICFETKPYSGKFYRKRCSNHMARVSTHHKIHWPLWGPAGRSCSFGWALYWSLWQKACHWQQATPEGFSVLWSNSYKGFCTPICFELEVFTVLCYTLSLPSHSCSPGLTRKHLVTRLQKSWMCCPVENLPSETLRPDWHIALVRVRPGVPSQSGFSP